MKTVFTPLAGAWHHPRRRLYSRPDWQPIDRFPSLTFSPVQAASGRVFRRLAGRMANRDLAYGCRSRRIHALIDLDRLGRWLRRAVCGVSVCPHHGHC